MRHARFGIWTVALTYGLSVSTGLLLVHAGNRFALDFRDKLIGNAQRESAILRQFQRGNAVTAAGMDAAGNAAAGLLSMFLQLIPSSLAGGVGVSIGIAAFASESRTGYRGSRMPWLPIPYFASLVRDCLALRIPHVGAAIASAAAEPHKRSWPPHRYCQRPCAAPPVDMGTPDACA